MTWLRGASQVGEYTFLNGYTNVSVSTAAEFLQNEKHFDQQSQIKKILSRKKNVENCLILLRNYENLQIFYGRNVLFSSFFSLEIVFKFQFKSFVRRDVEISSVKCCSLQVVSRRKDFSRIVAKEKYFVLLYLICIFGVFFSFVISCIFFIYKLFKLRGQRLLLLFQRISPYVFKGVLDPPLKSIDKIKTTSSVSIVRVSVIVSHSIRLLLIII